MRRGENADSLTSAQPGGDFASNFTFSAASATNYVNYVLANNKGFLKVGGTTWNGRTDQAFGFR